MLDTFFNAHYIAFARVRARFTQAASPETPTGGSVCKCRIQCVDFLIWSSGGETSHKYFKRRFRSFKQASAVSLALQWEA